MTKNKSYPQDEIDHYLRTGESDMMAYNWPGANIIEQGKLASQVLTDALIGEVRRRSERVTIQIPSALRGTDTVAFTRAKVEPMVRGLFPRKEQEIVLNLLEQSLVFLTPDTIELLIRKRGFLSTAWKLANIYLWSIGAETLSDEDGLIDFDEKSERLHRYDAATQAEVIKKCASPADVLHRGRASVSSPRCIYLVELDGGVQVDLYSRPSSCVHERLFFVTPFLR